MVSFSIDISPSIALIRESRVVRDLKDRAEPLDMLRVSIETLLLHLWSARQKGAFELVGRGKCVPAGHPRLYLPPENGPGAFVVAHTLH